MPDVLFALTGDIRHNSRALRQLRSLAALGASVEVIALADRPQTTYLPSGIPVHLLKKPEGSGPLFFWRVHRAFRNAIRSTAATVYHASDLYTLPAMSAGAAATDGSLAFDSRELYPYVASTANRPWVRWFWQGVQAGYLPRTDAVFTVSESIAEELRESYDIPPPTVLYNAPAFEEVSPSRKLREMTGIPEDRAVILHQGSMRRDRGCEQLVAAMRNLDNAALVFLGSGSLQSTLEEIVQLHDLQDRIYFVPPVPPTELLPVTASADIGVTLLQDTCRNHRLALPNKLFEYLMAGLPVVASDLPEIRAVVRGFDVGRTVRPDDTAALAAALQKLVDRPGLRSSLASHTPRVFDVYSWEKSNVRFTEVYSKLLD